MNYKMHSERLSYVWKPRGQQSETVAKEAGKLGDSAAY